MRHAWILSVLFLVFGSFVPAAATRAAEVILQNDSFMSGQSVAFQGGFVAGEMAASRLVPSGTGPWKVTRVQFLFGGATTMQTITLHVWEDAGGTTNPGAAIFNADYSVTGSNSKMQEIDLTEENVQVTGDFRIGLEFYHDGYPSVARDDDGTIQTTRNFIYAPSAGGWYTSSTFGVSGDWILRAGVEEVEAVGVGDWLEAASPSLDGPNPVRSDARLHFTLPVAGPVEVAIFDARGRRSAVLVDEWRGAGTYAVTWRAAEGKWPAGIYFARMRAGGKDFTRRLVVLP